MPKSQLTIRNAQCSVIAWFLAFLYRAKGVFYMYKKITTDRW